MAAAAASPQSRSPSASRFRGVRKHRKATTLCRCQQGALDSRPPFLRIRRSNEPQQHRRACASRNQPLLPPFAT